MADQEKVINDLQFALDDTAVTGWGFAQVHKETVIDALELLKKQEAKEPTQEAQRDYEAASDMREYCERHEPTYNPDDGSM